MKREGRQHGMVRTHCILPSTTLASVITLPTRKANSVIGAPPTAGVFTRVPSKPTNHSKFTGKCRVPRCSSCHLHPSSKAKDKSKGSSKIRSSCGDLGKVDGHSSSKVLDDILHDYAHLGNLRRGEGEGEGEDEDEEEEEVIVYDDDVNYGCCDVDEGSRRLNLSTDYQNEIRVDENVDWNGEDDIGFYDLALILELLDGEEGWSLIGEI